MRLAFGGDNMLARCMLLFTITLRDGLLTILQYLSLGKSDEHIYSTI